MKYSCILQPVKSDSPVEGDDTLKEVRYERSPIMSTYLLAFVVGEYDYVEAKDADGVLIRVYTPVGKKEQGQFALDVSSGFVEGTQGQLREGRWIEELWSICREGCIVKDNGISVRF